VFDALAHAFWYDSTLPEAIEANKIMAEFFVKKPEQIGVRRRPPHAKRIDK